MYYHTNKMWIFCLTNPLLHPCMFIAMSTTSTKDELSACASIYTLHI